MTATTAKTFLSPRPAGFSAEALLTEDIIGIDGEADDNLRFIPRWAASATADHTVPLSGQWDSRLGGGIRYNGRSVASVTHSPYAVPLRWTFRLFDAATGGIPEVRGVPLQPRTIGLAADFKF